MAFIVREGEVIPVPIPVGKRVKIGSLYSPPMVNYVSNDQLWIQDIFVFNSIPWYAIRNRGEKWLFLAACWGAVVYVMTMLARYYL